MFIASFNRDFFNAILKVRNARLDVVMENIMSELGRSKIEEVGHVYAADLCFSPHPSLAGQFHQKLCEKATIRRAQALGRYITSAAPTQDDTDGFLSEINSMVSDLEVSHPTENLLKTSVDSFCSRLDDIASGKKLSGHKTPWNAWNGVFGGLNEASLYAIASRPGLGKTAMM